MRIKRVTTTVSRDEYEINICKRRRLKYLGCGLYANVYGNRNIAVKVGSDLDDPYLNYVRAVGFNSRNPMFPKIKSVVIYNTEYDQYYVVEMERLIRFWDVKEPMEKCEARYGIDVDSLDCDDYLSTKIRTTKAKYIKKALNTIMKMFRHHGSADMHTGNIMWRKRGKNLQLVITDPIS